MIPDLASRRPRILVLLVSTLVACGTPDPSVDTSVRDSAGVKIVTSAAPRAGSRGAWRVKEQSTLQIGGSVADPAYQLYGVVGAVRLGDGRIVIANAGTSQLRFYNPAGRYIQDIGAEGAGPGEFESIAGLHRTRGDSLLVYDDVLRRSTLLAPGGSVAAIVNIRLPDARLHEFVGPLMPRAYIVAAAPSGLVVEQPARERDSLLLVRIGMSEEPPDTISWIADQVLETRMRRVGRSRMVIPLPIHFTPRAVAAVGGGRVYVGSSDHYEIAVRRASGSLEMVLRRRFRPVPVSANDIDQLLDSFRARYAARSPDDRDREMGLVESVRAASGFPAFDRLLVDAEGNLWVRHYRRPGDVSATWDVFDRQGSWCCVVDIAWRLEVLDIGADYVMGVLRDSLDVELVALYPIVKP